MNVTESRFKNRQLHIEDYLRNRKSMQKCSTTLRLLKRAVSSQTGPMSRMSESRVRENLMHGLMRGKRADAL